MTRTASEIKPPYCTMRNEVMIVVRTDQLSNLTMIGKLKIYTFGKLDVGANCSMIQQRSK